MFTLKQLRDRRKDRQRFKIRTISPHKLRLSVHRSGKNIYAQIIDDTKGCTLVAANTLMEAAKKLKSGSNIEAAAFVGKMIAEAALKAKITEVVFDRSGFLYHGRIKSLADSAREHGLKF